MDDIQIFCTGITGIYLSYRNDHYRITLKASRRLYLCNLNNIEYVDLSGNGVCDSQIEISWEEIRLIQHPFFGKMNGTCKKESKGAVT